MKKIDLEEVEAWVSYAVTLHSEDLINAFSHRFQVDAALAAQTLNELVLSGLITRSGPANRPVFLPASNQTLMHSYSLPLHGAERIWQHDFAPFLSKGLTAQQSELIHEGFDAIADNASHYSHGSTLHIIVEKSLNNIEMTFQDNGMGIYKRMSVAHPGLNTATGILNAYITNHRNCSLNRLAPQFDYVQIESNGMCFPELKGNDDPVEVYEQGTTVVLALTLN